MTTSFEVVRQDWLESERGWGCRPDGYSLHRTSGDVQEFVRDYWARMPDAIPDEYSRPEGSPRIVTVDKEVYDRVVASKNGTRHY
ncbi:MAG: hypothetical protein KBD06_02715 [Candidatus Pacebacteria bacterium]|nr:hypothetical protein [Candidatus Paceibacterota bacterium]